MAIVAIDDSTDPRIGGYMNIKDRALRDVHGAFVVEGAGNVRCLLSQSVHPPDSLLVTPRAARALSSEIGVLDPELPVYVAEPGVFNAIVGFDMHRGCLALCSRDPEIALEELTRRDLPAQGSPLLVIEGMTNLDNVGGLFRCAQAFGVGAVLLCPRTCDPLYRKAIRTSMGASLCVPYARATGWPDALHALRRGGVRVVGLDPVPEARPLSSFELDERPIAFIVGSEGPGLSEGAREACDERIRIPMVPGMDSVNVSTAAGIALHHIYAAHLSRGIDR